MKRNRLMASITLGLFAAAGVAQAADGWYVAPSVGYDHSDKDRHTEEGSGFGSLGLGKYFGNNAAIGLAIDRTTRSKDYPLNSNFESLGVTATYRQFFGEGRFKPYVLVGAGASHHDRNISSRNDAGTYTDPGDGWAFIAQAGAGLSFDF